MTSFDKKFTEIKILAGKLKIKGVIILASTLMFFAGGLSTYAATLTVTKTSDTADGSCSADDCSLREAVIAAAAGDSIVFASPLFDAPQTITLLLQSTGSFSGLAINKSLTITGKGAHLLIIRRPPPASNSERLSVLSVNAPGAAVTLSGMTVTGGHGSTGGGINVINASLVTVSGCHITGNTIYTSSGGGGISSNAPLTVVNSTISNNSTPDNLGNFGGGIDAGGNLTVINSTISGNGGSTTIGGGIFISSGSAPVITNSTITDNEGRPDAASGIFTGSVTRVSNSIIAGNRHSSTVPDVGGGGGFISLGYNLIGNVGAITTFNQTGDQTGVLNPMLAPLAINGGPTPTHALLPGSPAIDKGKRFDQTTDQRGFIRPFDNADVPPASGGDDSDIGAFELSNESAVSSTRFDFDGDGRADISVFRPSEGNWFQTNSSNNSFAAVHFGSPQDEPAPADFDGDGKTDHAVFRDGVWYVLQSSNGQIRYASFGLAGDLPRPGDFEGDGKADIAVFRPSSGVWYWLRSSDGQFQALQFGQFGDQPMLGDFDGDDKTDPAVFRPSNGVWYVFQSSTGQARTEAFGLNGDIPVNGDFNGDGKADLAVFRPSNGTWYIARPTGVPAQNFESRPFGLASDIPVPADYDGDGKTDVAVYRGGVWYVMNSSADQFFTTPFGLGTDIPVPAVYLP